MIGALIEWVAQPIEGPLKDLNAATLTLVFQRGLLDGFLIGCVLTLIFASRCRSRKCKDTDGS